MKLFFKRFISILILAVLSFAVWTTFQYIKYGNLDFLDNNAGTKNVKAFFSSTAEDDNQDTANSDNIKNKTRNITSNKTNETFQQTKLVLGGQPLGVKFYMDGIAVISISEVTQENGNICSPAYESGIRIKDIIKSVNGKDISGNEDIVAAVKSCNGKSIEIKAERNGSEYTTKVTPVQEKGVYKIGITVRDSTAGIGTITYFDPENKTFAALGHGISDADTLQLLPLKKGDAVGADITNITKGAIGSPGELQGIFIEGIKIGSIYLNSAEGIFGDVDNKFDYPQNTIEPMKKEDVKEGNASILCTIDDTGVQEYSIQIIKISRTANQTTKNMIIQVTDETLLSKTGGIVQGMSGSPIIQDGKLVGAVTHVLVNDPTQGYGIFIENMLIH